MNTLSINPIHHRIFVEARRLSIALCACLLALLSHLPLHAAPGDPDPSFGQDGHAAFSFPEQAAVFAQASVFQANGKFTIAGACGTERFDKECVLRMLSNGALDTGFGNEGRAVIAEFGQSGNIAAVAYQDDGRLLLGGDCRSGVGTIPCVVRLQANGALDTSFGTQGVVTLSVPTWSGSSSGVRSIQALPDGRIALGVSCRPLGSIYLRLCASRLQSNGELDTSFGGSGTVTVAGDETLGAWQYLNSAAIDEAGRWLLAGSCSEPFSERFCAVRLQPNGARDLTFGTNGAFVSLVANTEATPASAVLNADGGFVLGGNCFERRPENVIVWSSCFVAATPTGQLDRAFGTNGVVVLVHGDLLVNFGSFVRQSDGALVIVKTCYLEGQSRFDFCLRRLRVDGNLDSTLPLKIDARDHNQNPVSVAVDAQGRILVAGACESAAGLFYSDQLCVTRYEGGPFANTMCSFDLDGDGSVNPSVDGLIMVRASLGFSANAMLQGVNFPRNAKRTVWGGGGMNDLRQYLVAQCGMLLMH
jgi:uncharacterized delta-60 repeat protein